jgi:hypothetical protein
VIAHIYLLRAIDHPGSQTLGVQHVVRRDRVARRRSSDRKTAKRFPPRVRVSAGLNRRFIRGSSRKIQHSLLTRMRGALDLTTCLTFSRLPNGAKESWNERQKIIDVRRTIARLSLSQKNACKCNGTGCTCDRSVRRRHGQIST